MGRLRADGADPSGEAGGLMVEGHYFVEACSARTSGPPLVTAIDISLPRSYAFFSVLAGVGQRFTDPIADHRGKPKNFFLPRNTIEEFWSGLYHWTWCTPDEWELAIFKASAFEDEVESRDPQYRLDLYKTLLPWWRELEARGHKVTITCGFEVQ